MRLRDVLLVLVVLVFVSACACRTRSVGLDGAHIPVAQEGLILKDVNFAFDSYQISPVAAEILRGHAEWLKNNPNTRVQIEGHCDERGTQEYNMVLGANRARAAMEYLRSLGISENRLSTVSYGKELPLDPRSNEEAWAKNRRAHFNILN